jgi:hypothetical protein
MIIVIHIFLFSIAAYCLFIAHKVLVAKDYQYVRNDSKKPIPNPRGIAKRYGIGYGVQGVILIVDAAANLWLGLPMLAWMLIATVTPVVGSVHRASLLAEAHDELTASKADLDSKKD